MEAWLLYAVVIFCIALSVGTMGREFGVPWMGGIVSTTLIFWINRWFIDTMKVAHGA